MIGRLAGFFLVVAAALTAVGAFPTWVTVADQGPGTTAYTAFSVGIDYRDAVISFAIAGVLLLLGFALAVRPMLWSRALACLAGMATAFWAGLVFFTLAPQTRDLIASVTAPAAPSTQIGAGLWLTAGGGALALLSGFVALVARRPRVAQRAAPAPATAATSPRAAAGVPTPEPVPAARPAAGGGPRPATGTAVPAGAPRSSSPPPAQVGPR